MDPNSLSLSVEEMRTSGYRVIDAIVERYANLARLSTGKKADPGRIRPQLIAKLQDAPEDFETVFAELRDEVLPFNGAIDHPRFFAFVPGPSNYIGALGDAIASGYNVFAGTWLEGSGAIAVELAVIDFLRRECGLPDTALGLFVSGGSVANITALTAAREVKLQGDFTGARAYFSTQTHSSIERGFRLIGFRPEHLVKVDADSRGAIYLPALRARIERDIAAGLRPFCIVANAGTTNSGAVDPFPELADMAAEFGLWLHADGAYGAAAILCDRGKQLLQGLERVDSLSFDPHKWLFQPFECGCVLVRNAVHLKNTFQIFPDYLADVHRHDREVNLCDYGIQLTRGFRALKLWLSLRVFGVAAFRNAVEHGFRLAEEAEACLRAKPRWEIVSPAQMAVIVFRFRGSDEDQIRIIDAMYANGDAFLTSTKHGGRTVMRLCTINPRTTVADIRSTIDLLDQIA
jgi:glutamate/tyrosine decarboxylase-like PLP-dependent enzyme